MNIFTDSLRLRLVALTSLLLLAVSIFLAVFFPARMGDVLRRHMEARIVSLAQVATSAVAPGIEFDDVHSVQESLEGVRSISDFAYALVRRANGTVMVSINPDRAPDRVAQGTFTLTLSQNRT